VISAF